MDYRAASALELQRAQDAFRLQASTAMELLQALDAPAIFKLIAERIYSLAGGAIVVFTEFDPRSGKVAVRQVQCADDERRRVIALLGRDPLGLFLDFPEEVRGRWKAGELAPVAAGLHELLFRQVPAAVCKRLARELKLGDAFGMACAHEDDLLGSVVLLARKRGPVPNQQLIEALVAQAALALKRARAEEARRSTEERFRLLFENTSDGVWIQTLDGLIREVNDAYCAMSGYTRAELVGMPVSGLEAVESPEEIARRIQELPGVGGHARFESKHRRKDGTLFDIDITALYIDREGGRVAIFARDVTGRRQAEAKIRSSEEALRRSEEFLSFALTTARTGAWDLDLDDLTMRRSPQHDRIFGYPELLPRWTYEVLLEHVVPEDREEVDRKFRQAVETRGDWSFECRIRRRDGETRWIWDVGRHRPDEMGRPRRIVGIVQDITEHKAAEEALREVDRRRTEFLAMLSHELRNPLAPIRNSLYILDRAAPGGDRAQRAKTVIDRQVAQLARLVDDLLDVTRITRSKIQLQRERVELNELVRRTMEDHRSLFEKGGVRFEVEPAREPLFASADWSRLAQVIGNLLQNSAKFTPPGGSVTASLAADPVARQAVIRVVDTGMGMPPEVLERLFQPFMQAEKTLDRSKGGLGLGLALVKGLVELHGGTVSGTSEGAGEGSVFTVRLPLDESAAVPAPARAPGAGPASRRVLVIEDNVDAAESLRELLQLDAHDVEIAHSGPEGLDKARAFRPDVVLCDIGLPGMDGFEVARAFRADRELSGAFLVALSGYALPEDLQRAQQAGFDRHLSKPAGLDKLAQLLGDIRSPRGEP